MFAHVASMSSVLTPTNKAIQQPLRRRSTNAGLSRSSHSIGPCNVDVKWLNRRPHPPDDFAGPERLAQQRHPAVFRLANGAKRIKRIRRLIGVEATACNLDFSISVGGLLHRSRSTAACIS